MTTWTGVAVMADHRRSNHRIDGGVESEVQCSAAIWENERINNLSHQTDGYVL